MSRCVRRPLQAGCRGEVVGVQRRACQVAVEDGPLLILTAPEVPLAPNALAVDVPPALPLELAGFRPGQRVALGAREAAPEADWWVRLGTAETWEPRPRVGRLSPGTLARRLAATQGVVLAEGAGGSLLLPLLDPAAADGAGRGGGILRLAGRAARRLATAASRRDRAALARAAQALAGLGPGLTPSGDDLLAGFAAAWTLLGACVGADGRLRAGVTAALAAGARSGASPLGRAWLGHACRGELLEPMTRFVAVLTAREPADLRAAARGPLAVGASSGTDWMVGFHLAAPSLLGRLPRRPPW